MIPDPITNHVEAAIERLIEHFSGLDKPTLYGLIRAHVGQIQDLEDVAWQVIWGRLLDSAPGRTERAEGVQLDVLGKIVGCERGAYPDAEYRHAIRLQIRVNRSFGTPEDLLQVTRLAIGALPISVHREEYHHVTYFYVEALSTSLAFVLHRSLQKTRAAGYRAVLEYYTDRIDPSRVFRWAHAGTGGNGGLGHGGDPTSGGLLTSKRG